MTKMMSKQQERNWRAMKEIAGVEARCVDCGDVRHVNNMCHTLIGEPVCPPCFARDIPANPVDDPVNHPSHYNSHPSGIECSTIARHENFNRGNALKYWWRAGLKSENPVEDYKKAIWYLEDEIKRIEGNAK